MLIPDDIGVVQWAALIFCAFLIGFSKTCTPGISILAVPLLASILPAKASVGFIHPLLIFADLFAITYYHRHAQWKYILQIFPWTLLGLAFGYAVMDKVNDAQLAPIIGAIILIMLGLWYWHDRKNASLDTPHINIHISIIAILGFFVGVSTMLANAAGPIITIYLVLLALPKNLFIGTGAWYIFIINLIKIPLNIQLNLITFPSLKLDFMLLPAIIFGALAGILLLKHISQKLFTTIIMILAALTAINLIL